MKDRNSVNKTRRRVIKAISAASLSAPSFSVLGKSGPDLYINTWGGLWEAAASTALFEPFTQETGINIKTVSPVSFAKLAAQVRTGVYEFDVTTLGGADLVRANRAGLIEPLPKSFFNLDSIDEEQFFENGVASHSFATVISYYRDTYPNGGPRNWRDFFDIEKYPGTRSMQRHASRSLPLAVLADGEELDKLYPVDIERALNKLDTIKDNVRVWWTQGAQSQQLLRDKEVDAIAIWHGRVLELQEQGHPVELVWNEGELDIAYWVVCKGTPRAKEAWEFINFAVQPKPLADFCKAAIYGPMNSRSFDYIEEEIAVNMPTYPDNKKLLFEQDVLAMEDQIDDLTRRFERWIVR